jgi:hypothetical protein
MWRQYKDLYLYYLIVKPGKAFIIDGVGTMPKVHIMFEDWGEGSWIDLMEKTKPIEKIDPPESWDLNLLGKFVIMSLFGEKDFIKE